MNISFKQLLLPIFFSALLPGMVHAAASNSIEEVENKIKGMTELIEFYIDKLEYPANEYLRLRLDSAANFGTDFLKERALFLEDTAKVICVIQEENASMPRQAIIRNIYSYVVDRRLSDKRSVVKQLNSRILGKQATPATFDDLINKVPTPKKQFLRNLLQDIEQQNSIMESTSKIADILSKIIPISEKIESMSGDYFKFLILLAQTDSSDPNIIAIKLKNTTEFQGMLKQGKMTEFSDQFCSDLLDTKIPAFEFIADHNLTNKKQIKLHKELALESDKTAKKTINNKLIKRNIINNNLVFEFIDIPFIEQFEQPTYFAKAALSLLMCLPRYRTELNWRNTSKSKHETEKNISNLAMLENSIIKLAQNYKAQLPALTRLQEEIRQEITPPAKQSLIDPHNLRSAKRQPVRARKKHKPAPKVVQKQSIATPCSSHTTEPTPTCSSSNVLEPVSEQPILQPTPICKNVEENASMIRIRDTNIGITLALFKLETPTAQSISSCKKTYTMNLWLNHSDQALQELGYFDPTHKNFTASPEYRTRMKQYHGFSERADSYVTQCGISKEYRKPDGSIHTMICMPGAIYFADGTYQTGIFTYLIDPANNQIYHRMFHECPGEKIVNEYQAQGYWDMDPELGLA